MESEQIQFSIYKIDLEKTTEELNLKEGLEIEKICDKLVSYINNYVKNYIKHGIDKIVIVEYDEFKLIYIKSTRTPIWKGIIEGMIAEGEAIDKDENIGKIKNESTSYILFYIVENNMYAMTGGKGSNYISKFIEKNFGLYLIPKLVDKNNPIIKKVVENNLTGNNLSTQRITKNITSVSMEESLGSIYRELSIQISNEIAKEFGIKEEEGERTIGVSSGDSIIIRKSISIEELKIILEKLNKIQQKKDKFILNYFVPVRKKRIKESTLKDLMIRMIKEENYKKFEILSDSIEEYYFSSYEYILESDGKEILKKHTPINMEDIVECIKQESKNLYINKITEILMKSEIETIDSNGKTIIPKTKIYNLISGCIEDDKGCYYLINGSWYVFEEHYFSMLTSQYQELFSNNEEISNKIILKYGLIKKCQNENEYNDMFIDDLNVVKGHKNLIGQIELADLIYWDEDNLYLMCNKGIFNGENVRDLQNQIYTSSKMLQSIKINDKVKLEEYYEKLNTKDKDKISKADFLKLFNKNIYFIAGFSSGFKKNTKSPYAKYLLVDLKRKLKNINCELVILNYGE